MSTDICTFTQPDFQEIIFNPFLGLWCIRFLQSYPDVFIGGRIVFHTWQILVITKVNQGSITFGAIIFRLLPSRWVFKKFVHVTCFALWKLNETKIENFFSNSNLTFWRYVEVSPPYGHHHYKKNGGGMNNFLIFKSRGNPYWLQKNHSILANAKKQADLNKFSIFIIPYCMPIRLCSLQRPLTNTSRIGCPK